MSFSDYCALALLNSLFGKTSSFGALATPPTMYVALCTAIPTPNLAGSALTEATYTGYARKVTAAADWAVAGGRILANANAITFAQCTGGTSTINSWALVDALTNGNVIDYGFLTTTPAVISAGNIVRAANVATVTLTAHGFITGSMVLISGCEQPEYNGWQVVTLVDANNFTFVVPNTPVTPATAATGVSMTACTTTTLAVSNNITPQFGAGTLAHAQS
jgi:hypothetical protein